MKALLYSVMIFMSFSSTVFSQEAVEKVSPPDGNALVGDFYGADVSQDSEGKAISVATLEGKLKTEKKIEGVVVKGLVTDVCEKRGCWLTVKTENGSSFFVKMKDYAFFVPTSLKGKNVVLEGNAEKKITTVADLKHYARDAKKTKAEIDLITSSKEEIRFLADGIKVVQ